MKINSLKVEGLHGFIDADISFFEDITVIVGRNGSGKTSVLELLANLIRLDQDALLQTRFKLAEVLLEDAETGICKIAARNDESFNDISITIGDKLQEILPLGIDPKSAFIWGATNFQDTNIQPIYLEN